MVGHHCEVQFLEDSEWYRAIVRGFDRATKLHNLWYYYDGEVQISFYLLSSNEIDKYLWLLQRAAFILSVYNLVFDGPAMHPHTTLRFWL